MHPSYKLTLLIVMLITIIPSAIADVQNVRASIKKNTTITLDLRESITNITAPVVSIASQPTNGTANAVACSDDTMRCIEYVPTTDFVGIETFNYQVTNDLDAIESATITINVGGASFSNEGVTSNQAIDETLGDICLDNTGGAISDLCAAFLAASEPGNEEDLRELLDALSPQNVASQGTLNNELIKEQLASISKRLASLRRGQQNTVLSGLTLQHNGETITGDMFDTLFASNTTGGSAGSASGFNKKWDWYISGKVGGGEQKESVFEDGFEFDANNITTGADIRIHNRAIIGAALGFSTADMSIDHQGGGMDIDGKNVTFYGSLYPSDSTYVDAVLNITTADFEMDRRILFGVYDFTATSDTESTSIALSIAGGYDYVITGGLSASFSGRLDYIDTAIDGYAESGGGGFEVAINGQDISQLVSTLGAQVNYAISLPWGVLLPNLSVSWLHQFDDDRYEIDGYFVAEGTGAAFSFESNAPDSDYFVTALGTSAVFAGGKSAFIQYETTLNQDNLDIWNISAGLRLEF